MALGMIGQMGNLTRSGRELVIAGKGYMITCLSIKVVWQKA
jgi:hypothetical protein